jgi:serine/threonine protein kinase
MEYVEDGSLEEYLRAGRVAPPSGGGSAWRLRVCALLLDGMRNISALGVVHRDLAARNVLLRHAGSTLLMEAKITDFGLSRVASRYMRAGGSEFAWRYAAIECLPNGDNFTTRSDVWAMGLVLWVSRRVFHALPLLPLVWLWLWLLLLLWLYV